MQPSCIRRRVSSAAATEKIGKTARVKLSEETAAAAVGWMETAQQT